MAVLPARDQFLANDMLSEIKGTCLFNVIANFKRERHLENCQINDAERMDQALVL